MFINLIFRGFIQGHPRAAVVPGILFFSFAMFAGMIGMSGCSSEGKITPAVENFFEAVKYRRLSDIHANLSSSFQKLFGETEEVQKEYMKLYMPAKDHPELKITIRRIVQKEKVVRVFLNIYSGESLTSEDAIYMIQEKGVWKVSEYGVEEMKASRSKGLFLNLAGE